MANESTSDLIDALSVVYGRPSTDIDARAKILEWLDMAQKDICAAYDWPFLHKVDTLNFVAGQSDIVMPTDVASVVYVCDSDYVEITRTSPELFDTLYRSSNSVSGTPEVWAEYSRDYATDQIKIRVWPTPDADSTGEFRYRMRIPELTDSDSDRPIVPEEFRPAIRLFAEKKIAINESDNNRADRIDSDLSGIIQQMVQKYSLDTRGMSLERS